MYRSARIFALQTENKIYSLQFLTRLPPHPHPYFFNISSTEKGDYPENTRICTHRWWGSPCVKLRGFGSELETVFTIFCLWPYCKARPFSPLTAHLCTAVLAHCLRISVPPVCVLTLTVFVLIIIKSSLRNETLPLFLFPLPLTYSYKHGRTCTCCSWPRPRVQVSRLHLVKTKRGRAGASKRRFLLLASYWMSPRRSDLSTARPPAPRCPWGCADRRVTEQEAAADEPGQ